MSRPSARRRAQGIVAIEFMVVLLLLLMVLPAALYFGRVFWQYNALQKACHGAARYMAAVPMVEMSNATAYAVAVATTRQMVTDALDAAHVSGERTDVDVNCRPVGCGLASAAPATIEVVMAVVVRDDIFSNFTADWLGGLGAVSLTADITVPYAR